MRRATKWASQIFSNRFFGMGGTYPGAQASQLLFLDVGPFWARSEAMASAAGALAMCQLRLARDSLFRRDGGLRDELRQPLLAQLDVEPVQRLELGLRE